MQVSFVGVDAGTFFEVVGDLVYIGLIGINVMDLMLGLRLLWM